MPPVRTGPGWNGFILCKLWFIFTFIICITLTIWLADWHRTYKSWKSSDNKRLYSSDNKPKSKIRVAAEVLYDLIFSLHLNSARLLPSAESLPMSDQLCRVTAPPQPRPAWVTGPECEVNSLRALEKNWLVLPETYLGIGWYWMGVGRLVVFSWKVRHAQTWVKARLCNS